MFYQQHVLSQRDASVASDDIPGVLFTRSQRSGHQETLQEGYTEQRLANALITSESLKTI